MITVETYGRTKNNRSSLNLVAAANVVIFLVVPIMCFQLQQARSRCRMLWTFRNLHNQCKTISRFRGRCGSRASNNRVGTLRVSRDGATFQRYLKVIPSAKRCCMLGKKETVSVLHMAYCKFECWAVRKRFISWLLTTCRLFDTEIKQQRIDFCNAPWVAWIAHPTYDDVATCTANFFQDITGLYSPITLRLVQALLSNGHQDGREALVLSVLPV